MILKADREKLSSYLVLSFFTFIFSYFLYILTDAKFIFYIGCMFLSAACGFHALKCIFKKKFNIGVLLSTQTMLWFSLPFSYIGFFGYESYPLPVQEVAAINGLFLVVIVCFLSYVVFSLIFESWKIDLYIFEDVNQYVVLIVPIVIFQAIFVYLGYRGYANVVGLGQDAPAPPLIYQFIEGLSPPIMPIIAALLATYISSESRRKNKLVFMFLMFSLVIQIIWWATGGRRMMTVVSIISFVLFFSVYFNEKLNFRKFIIISISTFVLVFLLYFSWQFYFLLRVATSESGGLENLGIFDVSRARDISALSDVNRQFEENVIFRPFFTLLSFVIIRDAADGFLWGWNVFSQFLFSIPSFFFTDKFGTVGVVQEALWAEALGVPLTDYTNTVFLEGYVDFGFFGFPIYAIIFYIISNIVRDISIKSQYNTMSAFAFFTVLFLMMNVETGPNTIFVCDRSILSVAFIYFCFKFIGFRLPSRKPPPPKDWRP